MILLKPEIKTRAFVLAPLSVLKMFADHVYFYDNRKKTIMQLLSLLSSRQFLSDFIFFVFIDMEKQIIIMFRTFI